MYWRMVLRLDGGSEVPGKLKKTQVAESHSQSLWISRSGWGPGMCFSNESPGVHYCWDHPLRPLFLAGCWISHSLTIEEKSLWPSQVVLVGKNPPANAGDVRDKGSIPGSGRSFRGGHGNPFQYSCLENPMDWGAWRAIVRGVARVGHNLATEPPQIFI